jgi:hypothetical protein
MQLFLHGAECKSWCVTASDGYQIGRDGHRDGKSHSAVSYMPLFPSLARNMSNPDFNMVMSSASPPLEGSLSNGGTPDSDATANPFKHAAPHIDSDATPLPPKPYELPYFLSSLSRNRFCSKFPSISPGVVNIACPNYPCEHTPCTKPLWLEDREISLSHPTVHTAVWALVTKKRYARMKRVTELMKNTNKKFLRECVVRCVNIIRDKREIILAYKRFVRRCEWTVQVEDEPDFAKQALDNVERLFEMEGGEQDDTSTLCSESDLEILRDENPETLDDPQYGSGSKDESEMSFSLRVDNDSKLNIGSGYSGP